MVFVIVTPKPQQQQQQQQHKGNRQYPQTNRRFLSCLLVSAFLLFLFLSTPASAFCRHHHAPLRSSATRPPTTFRPWYHQKESSLAIFLSSSPAKHDSRKSATTPNESSVAQANKRVFGRKPLLLGLLGSALALVSFTPPVHAVTFSPISLRNGFVGGSLIGTAAGVTLLGAGEIMGFSGIISPVLQNPVRAWKDPSQQWKFAFLSTFFLSSLFFFLPMADAAKITAVASVTSPVAYVLSGLLVGLGTRLGNGCTSGHGICGIPRRSRRSISAVVTFLTTAVLTTIVTSPQQPTGRYFQFLRTGAVETYLPPWIMPSVVALWVGLSILGIARHANNPSNTDQQSLKWIPAAVSGVLASVGLARSSMVYPASVSAFLNFGNLATWDPTLMMVMSGGLLTSFVAYQFVPGHSVLPSSPKLDKPLVAERFGVPTNTVIDTKLSAGAMLFGVGWGITGLCPGPALLLTMTGLSGMLFQWWPAFWVGGRVAEALKTR